MRRRALLGGIPAGESFTIPVVNCSVIGFYISTRSNNIKVDFGDGTKNTYEVLKFIDNINQNGTLVSNTYSTLYTGDITITLIGGLKDLFSLRIEYWQISSPTHTAIVINNFGKWIGQFPNLYSFNITGSYTNQIYNTSIFIKGSLFDVPESVEMLEYRGVQTASNSELSFDLDTFPANSKMRWIHLYLGMPKIIGDLANLPETISFFKLEYISGANFTGSNFTYSGGRIWAEEFDTLNLSTYILGTSETDDLLNDLANSVTTATGSKEIALARCVRTEASDSAVNYLEGLGFTVTVIEARALYDANYLFRMDFDNNFNTYSKDVIGIESGNGKNVPFVGFGGTSGLKLSGRVPGEYSCSFYLLSLKTVSNLNIETDAITIAFWLKKNLSGNPRIINHSSDPENTANTFRIWQQDANKGVRVNDKDGSTLNSWRGDTRTDDNVWYHIVVVIDRSLPATDSTEIYVDGVLDSKTSISTNNTSGDFGSHPLYIGLSNQFRGELMRLKILDYALDATNVSDLYNNEL